MNNGRQLEREKLLELIDELHPFGEDLTTNQLAIFTNQDYLPKWMSQWSREVVVIDRTDGRIVWWHKDANWSAATTIMEAARKGQSLAARDRCKSGLGIAEPGSNAIHTERRGREELNRLHCLLNRLEWAGSGSALGLQFPDTLTQKLLTVGRRFIAECK